MNKKSGCFLIRDIRENLVVITWEELAGQTVQLSEKIRNLAPVLISAYTKTEVEFARKHPECVAQDFMLKSLAPLVSDISAINWAIFEEKTKKILAQFFETTDWAGFSNVRDRHIFVTATDKKTGKILGVIQFIISPEFAKNNVKAALSGVVSHAQDRGIEKILMSSIFKIYPNVERIFLDTRSTNQAGINEYANWGFTQFACEMLHWTNLEYVVACAKSKTTETLQQVAERLITQG